MFGMSVEWLTGYSVYRASSAFGEGGTTLWRNLKGCFPLVNGADTADVSLSLSIGSGSLLYGRPGMTCSSGATAAEKQTAKKGIMIEDMVQNRGCLFMTEKFLSVSDCKLVIFFDTSKFHHIFKAFIRKIPLSRNTCYIFTTKNLSQVSTNYEQCLMGCRLLYDKCTQY